MSKFGAIRRGLKSKYTKSRKAAKDKGLGKIDEDAQGVQAAEMADARAGAVYFLGHCDLKTLPPGGTGFFSGMKDGFISNTTGLQDAVKFSVWGAGKIDAHWELSRRAKDSAVGQWTAGKVDALKSSAAVQWSGEALARLKAWIKEQANHFVIWLQRHLKRVYGYLLDAVEGIAEFLGWLSFQFGAALSEAAPGWGVVTSLSEMYQGIKQGFIGGYRFIEQIVSGRGVELLGGHPSVIASALARHAAAMVGSGIKDFSVGTAKLATNATPVGSVIGIVTGIVQRVFNLIDAFIQRFLVNRVLKRARDAWQAGGRNCDLASGHHTFSTWFRDNTVATPVIAALVLSSNFVGHPMRFLKLMDPGGEVVSQASFDAGVKHIQVLKKNGGKYLRDYGDGYRTTFASADPLVKSVLAQTLSGGDIAQ